jgi:hypothetical protein
VLAGDSATITGKANFDFRPEIIITASSISTIFTISKISIAEQGQQAAAGEMLAQLFSEGSEWNVMNMDTVKAQVPFTLTVTNKSGTGFPHPAAIDSWFYAVVLGSLDRNA